MGAHFSAAYLAGEVGMKLLASAGSCRAGPCSWRTRASPSARRSRSKRSSKMYKAWPRRRRLPSRRRRLYGCSAGRRSVVYWCRRIWPSASPPRTSMVRS